MVGGEEVKGQRRGQEILVLGSPPGKPAHSFAVCLLPPSPGTTSLLLLWINTQISLYQNTAHLWEASLGWGASLKRA